MEDLTTKHDELVVQKMHLDKFFTLFLDKFHSKMDPGKPNTPIWKLYKLKLNEYDDIQRQLRATEYWLQRSAHV